MPASGFYTTEVIGALRPPAQILQWDIDVVDPGNYRHFESGEYKPFAKLGLRGGFTAQHESGVAIDFGEVYIDSAGFYTETAAITFNLGEVNSHIDSYFDQAVGIGSPFKAFNLRLWIENQTAFSGLNPTFYYLVTSDWQRGLHMTSGTVGAQVMPSSLPATANVGTRSSDTLFVSGVHNKDQFSRYVFLVGSFPSGNYSLGTYGDSAHTFVFRWSYDWTDILANVTSEDIV